MFLNGDVEPCRLGSLTNSLLTVLLTSCHVLKLVIIVIRRDFSAVVYSAGRHHFDGAKGHTTTGSGHGAEQGQGERQVECQVERQVRRQEALPLYELIYVNLELCLNIVQ